MNTHTLFTANRWLITRAMCAKAYSSASNHGPRLLYHAGRCWHVVEVSLAPLGYASRIELAPAHPQRASTPARRKSIDDCTPDDWRAAAADFFAK